MLIGIIMGLAIYNGVLLDLPLPQASPSAQPPAPFLILILWLQLGNPGCSDLLAMGTFSSYLAIPE